MTNKQRVIYQLLSSLILAILALSPAAAEPSVIGGKDGQGRGRSSFDEPGGTLAGLTTSSADTELARDSSPS